MRELATFGALLTIVIIIACVVNKIFPPDYHQRIEEEYKE